MLHNSIQKIQNHNSNKNNSINFYGVEALEAPCQDTGFVEALVLHNARRTLRAPSFINKQTFKFDPNAYR